LFDILNLPVFIFLEKGESWFCLTKEIANLFFKREELNADLRIPLKNQAKEPNLFLGA